MTLPPGSRLGTYDVIDLLGAGGMGEMYRARDRRLGRDVAIKVLPASQIADEGSRRRFLQEARAASALNHPNIITIYEIESANDVDFIVMEYVDGRSLAASIPSEGIAVREVLRLALPMADALARAHERGIVHRDLKPERSCNRRSRTSTRPPRRHEPLAGRARGGGLAPQLPSW